MPPSPQEEKRRRRAAGRQSWAVRLARLGYAARGVVFVGIGLGAGAVASGLTERPRGAVGVIRAASRLPLGDVLLAALGLGLAGYAALNFAGAIRDPHRHGAGPRGWVLRGADAVAGGVYVALAAAALRLLAEPGHRAAATAADWAAYVLRLPAGAFWLGALGTAVLAAGAFLVRKAWVYPFGAHLDRRAMGARATRWTVGAARVGTLARALLFVLCGASALQAALLREPARVADVAGGLEALGDGTLGPLVLGAAALGFVAYGAYQLVKARHRRLDLG